MNNQAKLREYRTFVTRALQQPSTVGAVLPTSEHVAKAVARVVPASGAARVLELGPGTGALSNALHERLPAAADHFAVEIDPELVRYLRNAKPWLEVIEGDARHLTDLLAATGREQVDAVISSIPWTLLPAEQQRALLGEVSKALTPQGVFTTVTYLTTLWRANTIAFTRLLEETFEEVLPRSAVWRNVPPARVYACRRPIK